MRERPKSREETPKEGDGSRTLSLPHCNNIHRVAQNASGVDLFLPHFPQNLLHFVQSRSSLHQSGFPPTLKFKVNPRNISWLIEPTEAVVHLRKIEAGRL